MPETNDAFSTSVRLPEGPKRTAALAAWFQGLFEKVGAAVPVLVGGAAAELYTGGAYTSGDLDFVGDLPDAVETRLKEVGFQRQGRHWVHRGEEIYLELPGAELDHDEHAVRLKVDEREILVIDLEALLVDRLAAWEFWHSDVDGVVALSLLRMHGSKLDRERLERLADAREVTEPLVNAERFLEGNQEPSEQEIATWATRRE